MYESYCDRKFICLGFVMFMILSWGTSPLFAQAPVYQEQFESGTLAELGWTINPVGDGSLATAFATVGTHPDFPTPDFDAGERALVIRASAGEGALLFGPSIGVGNTPALIRFRVSASEGGGNIAIGALNVPQGGTVAETDGSVNYAFEMNTVRYTNRYGLVAVLMDPSDNGMVPVVQLAVPHFQDQPPVTLTVDNIEIFLLDQNLVSDPLLQDLFGITQSMEPTPTPTVNGATPTPTPTINGATPTPTPTVTPTPLPGGTSDIAIDTIYTISPTDDNEGSFSPEVAFGNNSDYAMASNDLTEGQFIDVFMRSIDTDDNSVSDSFLVNQTFEDTETQEPDIDVQFSGTRHIVWSDDRSVEKLKSIYLAQMDTFGNKLNEEDFEVNRLFEETNATQPAIAVGDSGNMVITWQDDRNFLQDVFVRRMRWNGSQLEVNDPQDFQINIPFENTNVSQPEVALDDTGSTILVVWSDDRVNFEGSKRDDIYGRMFTMQTEPTDSGTLPGSIEEIEVTDFDDVTFDLATQPRVAFSEGHYTVVWQSEFPSDNNRKEIRAAVLDLNGNLVQPEFIIAGEEEGQQLLAPSIAAVNEGQFLISWYNQDVDELFGIVYDSQDHVFVSPVLSLVTNVFDVRQTSVAGDGENGFLIGWDGAFGEVFELFAADGSLVQVNGLNAVVPSQPVVQNSPIFNTKSRPVYKTESARAIRVLKDNRESTTTSPQR